MLKYYRLIIKQALVETVQFIGLDLSLPSIVRSVIGWLALTFVAYFVFKEHLPNKFVELWAACLGMAAFLLLVFPVFLFRIPSKIFYEQDAQIKNFQKIFLSKKELKDFCDSLLEHYQKGTLLLESLRHRTLDDTLSSDLNVWLQKGVDMLKNSNCSQSDVFNFSNPYGGSSSDYDALNKHLCVFQIIISGLLKKYDSV